MNSTGLSNKKENKIPFDYIDDDKIKNIYNNVSDNLQKNKKDKIFNQFMKEIPENIKMNLKIQENTLKWKYESDNKFKNMTKYLANKTNKNEEDLLMNTTDKHRIKKEFAELILNKSVSSYENKIPLGNWMMNLRQAKENNIAETSYINYGDIYNPLWIPVRERKEKSVDIVRNPDSNTRLQIEKFYNFKNLMDSHEIDVSSYNQASMLANPYTLFSNDVSQTQLNKKNVYPTSLNTFNKTYFNRDFFVNFSYLKLTLFFQNF